MQASFHNKTRLSWLKLFVTHVLGLHQNVQNVCRLQWQKQQCFDVVDDALIPQAQWVTLRHWQEVLSIIWNGDGDDIDELASSSQRIFKIFKTVIQGGPTSKHLLV